MDGSWRVELLEEELEEVLEEELEEVLLVEEELEQ